MKLLSAVLYGLWAGVKCLWWPGYAKNPYRKEQNKARAHLIAAAPDLYAACKFAVQGYSGKRLTDLATCMAKLKATLTKADKQ